MKLYGVIMAGGSGTRFWPLSRQEVPKQFLNITGPKVMLNETFDRMTGITEPENIYVVTGKIYGERTFDIMEGRLKRKNILEEPEARNTAACIGYAAMEILRKQGDGIMCIMPSDHYVQDEKLYADTVKQAAALAEQAECLVTIGIEPTYPATGYGYIKGMAQESEASEAKPWHIVERFVEKPDEATAKAYIEEGQYLWNSGMFVWKASVILRYFEKLLPDIYACLLRIGEAMGTAGERQVLEEVYPSIPKISIDYGIMEHADKVYVLEGSFGWNDVGSFDELKCCHKSDADGNIAVGRHVMIDTKDTVCYSKGRMIAALGVDNLIIVETEDAVLVCAKDRAQDVRKIVEELSDKDGSEYL